MPDAPMTLIVGQRGSGKSTLMNEILDREGGRQIVFDPVARSPQQRAHYKRRGYKLCTCYRELRNELLLNYRGFEIVYAPDSDSQIEALDELAADLLELQRMELDGKETVPRRSWITLAIDEMSNAYPSTGMKAEFKAFGKVCSEGRHWGIRVIGATQRPKEVRVKFRSGCTERAFFRLTDGTDLKAVKELISEEYVKEISELEKLHYIWKDENGISRKKTSFA